MAPVITVENLSKAYLVGHQTERARYVALRDVIAREARNLGRKTVDLLRGRQLLAGDTIEEFWALKDVNFEVQPGEVLGIIGRNGAGKSTLLKMLSRITEPTTGRIVLEGRVASLLEVGTGFHPELTGRENVFLNGAILGLTRAEIRRRFDEIVAFAEVEKFLDTPVKRYSSGMYVRLAFAVAAHLDPDILIVDEVLAVGDAEFQKKCLGKMDDTAKQGRTVLFVSHDMRRAASLCTRGLLLRGGKIARMGPINEVVDAYLGEHNTALNAVDLTGRRDRTGHGDLQFSSIALSSDGAPAISVSVGRPFEQTITMRVNRPVGPVSVRAIITTSDGLPVYELVSGDAGLTIAPESGETRLTISQDSLPLYPGGYFIDLWMGDRSGQRIDYITQAMNFTVLQEGGFVERELIRTEGVVMQRAQWRMDTSDDAKAVRHG